MQPRVTAIVVARDGAIALERTLSSLASQTRQPDSVVAVDAGSADSSAAILARASAVGAGFAQLLSGSRNTSFGTEIARAIGQLAPTESADEWIWLLAHDNAPHASALAALLGAVEIAPSVAIAGPKLMRADRPDTIAEYGESMTRLGASVILVENELDQSQYDAQSDLLGVAASGMLVRRSVWSALGGFDPGLPSVDAALDFCIRARLAGHRVVGVPAARVATAGGPEGFGRAPLSSAALSGLRRSAQLHRRMVYSPATLLPIHWLTLVPLAVLRSIGQIVRKHPAAIAGELAAAFGTAFSARIAPARRNLARTKKLGWGSIAALRLSGGGVRERRSGRRAPGEYTAGEYAAGSWAASNALSQDSATEVPRVRASFLSGGGAAVTLLAAVIGVLAFSPLLGATAVAGGALLPLSTSVGELWSHVGYGWHDLGGGFVGASDPFAAVLALLGTLTFWAPSFGIVLFTLVALPLAALGAWWCATRLTERAWPAAIGAVLWSLAPPLLSSMTTGHFGAVIAHVLLPWLVLATLSAARSWAASAAAALLFAVVAASAPILVPALVLLLLVWLARQPRQVLRLGGILVPAAVLFVPLVVAQLQRGTPLGLLADPGLPVESAAPSAYHLALGSPDTTLGGWADVGGLFGLHLAIGPFLVAVLFLPFAVLALAAAFLPGTRRSIPALGVAFLGFATAVAASHLAVTSAGVDAVSVWPGAGLSLFWLGLTAAAILSLDMVRRRVALPALVVAIASTLAVVPLLIAPLSGRAAAVPSTGALVPAYVAAQTKAHPRVGTLVLDAQPDGGLAARVVRGAGATLDDQSTFVASAPRLTAKQRAVAELAANLASRSGLDTAAILRTQRIGFVVLSPQKGSAAAAAVHSRAVDALDENLELTPVGDTSQGLLWRYVALPAAGLAAPEPSGGFWRPWYLAGLGVVFLITALLAVPTGRRRQHTETAGAAGSVAEERATLGEDDDA